MPIIYDAPSSAGGGTTLGGLVEEVLLQLLGYTTKAEQVTFLTSDLDAGTLTFKPEDVEEVSRGVIEIGTELIRVHKVDRTQGVVTVLPQGRGWRGTAPAAHPAGSTVTMSPLVPRASIAAAINDTIRSLYPSVFAVGEDQFVVADTSTRSWAVPTEADRLLVVQVKDREGNWQRVRRWELETHMNSSDFPTGRSIRLYDIPAGDTVRIVYGYQPTPLTGLGSGLTDSGLTESHRDLLVLGAQVRLLPALDVARLSVKTAVADELDQPVPIGSAQQLAQAIGKRYQERLTQEQGVLANRYPTPIHFVR